MIRANRRTSFASYMRRGSTSLAAFACRLRVRIDLLRLPAPSPRRAHGSSRSTAMREDERPLTIPVLIALHFRLRLCYSDPKVPPELLWAPGIVYLTNRISDVPAKQEGLEPEHGPEQPVPSDELVTSLFALVFVKGFGQLLSACSAVQHCTPTQIYVACRRRRSGCAARWPFAFEATRTGRYGLQWERTSSSSTCSPTIASHARPRFRSSTRMRSRCGCCKPRSYR